MSWDKVQSTADIQVMNVKFLVYGLSGAGKTRLTRTLPQPFILSAEAGLLSLRQEQIPYARIETVDDLSYWYDWFYRAAMDPDPNNQVRQHVKSIGLDSITEIAEQILANAKAKAKDPRQAYGDLLMQAIDTIKKFRDLPYFHVYMSCKQEYQKDEVAGTFMNGPMMPGSKVGPQLPYLFDEVFQLAKAKDEKGTEFHFLRTQTDGQNVAKDRSGALDVFEPADLGHCLQKIMATAV